MRRRTSTFFLTALFGVGLGGPALAGPASAARPWAPAATAAIHPGVGIAGGCTTNFVFYDLSDVYIGTAAHCLEAVPALGDRYCGGKSLPLGTPATVVGASRPATLVYSSWLTMNDAGTDPGAAFCTSNDFALVRLDRADHAKVNPSIPHWGAPTGLRFADMKPGERFVAYANSDSRMDEDSIKPLEGTGETDNSDGWEHVIQFVTPGIPGDSGSAVLDNSGSAYGVVTRLLFAPPASTGVSDLGRILTYMRQRTGLSMRLAEGTEPFTGHGNALAPAPEPVPDPQPEPVPPAAAPPAATAPPAVTPGRARPAKQTKKAKARCPKGKVRRRIRGSRRTRCVRRGVSRAPARRAVV